MTHRKHYLAPSSQTRYVKRTTRCGRAGWYLLGFVRDAEYMDALGNIFECTNVPRLVTCAKCKASSLEELQ